MYTTCTSQVWELLFIIDYNNSLSYISGWRYAWGYAEVAGIEQEQVAEGEVPGQEVGDRRVAVRYAVAYAGIRTAKPEKTEEESRKVAEMVKGKNYNHPEIGILRQNELERMKVPGE